MRRRPFVRCVVGALLAGLAATAGYAGECADCHGAAGRPAGAADLTAYWGGAAAIHHPVGGRYPPADDPAYAQPDARAGDLHFFDRNGNRILDPDEVRLSAQGTLECASCHREHGDGAPADAAEPAHVRGSNADSALCRTCHRI